MKNISSKWKNLFYPALIPKGLSALKLVNEKGLKHCSVLYGFPPCPPPPHPSPLSPLLPPFPPPPLCLPISPVATKGESQI